jgi:hypothetical protein
MEKRDTAKFERPVLVEWRGRHDSSGGHWPGEIVVVHSNASLHTLAHPGGDHDSTESAAVNMKLSRSPSPEGRPTLWRRESLKATTSAIGAAMLRSQANELIAFFLPTTGSALDIL